MTEQDKKTPLLYEGREQSLVKHEVLKQYLRASALEIVRERRLAKSAAVSR